MCRYARIKIGWSLFIRLEVAISWAHLQTPGFHLEIEDAPSFGSMNEPFTSHMKEFSFDLMLW